MVRTQAASGSRSRQPSVGVLLKNNAAGQTIRRSHIVGGAAIAISLLSCACVVPSHAFSPPSVIPPIGSVSPVEPGVVNAGASFYLREERYDGRVDGVSAFVRTGLVDSVEVNLAVRGGWLGAESNVSPDSSQAAARTGVRLSHPRIREIIALDLGIGAGTHQGGSYIAPDIALTFGQTRPQYSIWTRFELAHSIPLSATEQQVLVMAADGEVSDAVWGPQVPQYTRSFMIREGVSVALTTTGRVRPSILASIAIGEAHDQQDETRVFDVWVGMSFSFHRAEPTDLVPVETDGHDVDRVDVD